MEINRNISLDVGTTAEVVSKTQTSNNTIRSSIIIINTSPVAQKISLSIGAEAVSGQGLVLEPGGSWQDSRDGNYLPTQQLITAISDGAGGTLAIQERLNTL